MYALSSILVWSATPGFEAASYMPALFLERGLFVRERNDGMSVFVLFTYTCWIVNTLDLPTLGPVPSGLNHTFILTLSPTGLYLVFTYLVAKMVDELFINWVASLGVAAMTFYGEMSY